MAERTERTHLLLTPEEQADIDDWRYANKIPTRSEAIRALIRKGLGTGFTESTREPFTIEQD